MQAIHANPKNIKDVFNSSYEIPQFQRRYSWEKNECDKLWNDILEHFLKIKDNIATGENYYLGTIVVYKDINNSKFQVIDGQQRLTSLLLLIRALHRVNKTYDALKECIYEKDELDSKFSSRIRLSSMVFDEDKKSFELTIGEREGEGNGKFRSNFDFFCQEIQKLPESDMNNFIKTLLYKVVLLPIECGSEDHALTIFERLNDTGMALSDSDIFKSKLYGYYLNLGNNSEKSFVHEWNEIKDHEWLFRVHMHYCRARDGITDSEIALRTFINNEFKKNNTAPHEIFSFIKKNNLIRNFEAHEALSIKNHILGRHPNIYWKFPVYIWILRNGTFNEDAIIIDDSKNNEFLELLDTLHKFCVVKGITHKTVSAEKSHIFHLCKDIFESKDNYLERFYNEIANDTELFLSYLDNSSNIGRYLNLLIFTIASLNPEQESKGFLSFLNRNTINIEHILPKKWADCNYWDEASASDHIDQIANLVLFEQKLNIKASNDFFKRKKEIYSSSQCQDVKDLCNFEIWDVNSVNKRLDLIKQRLTNWLCDSKTTLKKDS